MARENFSQNGGKLMEDLNNFNQEIAQRVATNLGNHANQKGAEIKVRRGEVSIPNFVQAIKILNSVGHLSYWNEEQQLLLVNPNNGGGF